MSATLELEDLGKKLDWSSSTNYNMYSQWSRLIGAEKKLEKEFQALLDERLRLQGALDENEVPKNSGQSNRNSNSDQDREFKCPMVDCTKTYRSDLSLQQHIRVKHSKKVREPAPATATLIFNHLAIKTEPQTKIEF
eukprot:Platyproteum_vivax@DN12685_c0_g1_i1.p1